MDWREKLLDQLADCVPCGYERGGPTATEPTALASMALVALGRTRCGREGTGVASGDAAGGWKRWTG